MEAERFRGICYKAANWVYVGSTTGRGRDSKPSHAALPINVQALYSTCLSQPIYDFSDIIGSKIPLSVRVELVGTVIDREIV